MKFDYPDDNLTLHTDVYELNMMQAYWKKGVGNHRAVFEASLHKVPFSNGYAIFAGSDHIIRYVKQLHFTDNDIECLKSTNQFDDDFLEYLRNFKFASPVNSFEGGDLVFNHKPIIRIDAPIIKGQLIETTILNILSYQIMTATKASRIKSIVGDQIVMEFGSRRTQGLDAALWGTRTAYIGGSDATSNVRVGKLFGIPISGAHTHALMQVYMNGYGAFKVYAKTHHNCIFLVDTFDTLKGRVPSAIKAAKELGDEINFIGIHINSGDMAYLSKKVRKVLGDAGFPDAKIIISNGLGKKIIQNLQIQGAKIDAWGIGTKLITAYDQPASGTAYKLVATEDEDGQLVDTIKISNNVGKMSTPGKKQVWRINDRGDDKSEGDCITLADEDPHSERSPNMFNPNSPLQQEDVKDFTTRPMLKPTWQDGKYVYNEPTLEESRQHRLDSSNALWDEYKHDLNPEIYPVDLSQKCYDNKLKLIHQVHEYVKSLNK